MIEDENVPAKFKNCGLLKGLGFGHVVRSAASGSNLNGVERPTLSTRIGKRHYQALAQSARAGVSRHDGSQYAFGAGVCYRFVHSMTILLNHSRWKPVGSHSVTSTAELQAAKERRDGGS